jgi:hypothetical protein
LSRFGPHLARGFRVKHRFGKSSIKIYDKFGLVLRIETTTNDVSLSSTTAGSLHPRCELTTDLLGELGSDLVAEEGGDVFGFDSEDGLPGKLFIEGFQDGLRAEHQISGVLDLHETPMVGLSEGCLAAFETSLAVGSHCRH